MGVPETRYARSGDLQIAYQALGEGPLDIVFVPPAMGCIDVLWEFPGVARMLRRIASFSRLMIFDRRGSGASDGMRGVASLEEQIDDVRAVLDAVGAEQAAVISIGEGGMLGALFAASHPMLPRALVMMTPFPRAVRGPGYEWAQSAQERAVHVQAMVEYWGSESPLSPVWSGFPGVDSEQVRRAFARMQRLALSPAAAAAMFASLGEVDVREVLPSIRCATLVMRRADDDFFDARHSRYVADHVPNARYVELPGGGPVFLSERRGRREAVCAASMCSGPGLPWNGKRPVPTGRFGVPHTSFEICSGFRRSRLLAIAGPVAC